MRAKKEPKCATPNCRHPARKNKRKDGTFGYAQLCSGCDKKRWRKENPMKASYQTLKYNSTRRHVFFDLTFEEFAEFCYETNYMAGKGRSKESHTVDRKIDGMLPGYTKGNIQALPKGINSQKEIARRKNKVLVYDWETGTATVV